MSGYQDTHIRPLPSQSNSFASTPRGVHTPLEEKSPFDGSSTRLGTTPALGSGRNAAGVGAGISSADHRAALRGMTTARHDNWKEPKGWVPTNPTKRRLLFFGVPIALLLIAGIGIGVGVGVSQSHKSSSSNNLSTSDKDSGSSAGSGSGNSTTSANSTAPAKTLLSGSNGSTIDTGNGTSFTYVNQWGGNWAEDSANPYNTSGRAQSWTPSLTEEWTWGKDGIKGVNLGGWLVTEPFIVPNLYEQYQNSTPQAIDEYTLSQAMGADLATKMEEHYSTFITEQDFADIANAGLNYLRIPLGYWAVEANEGEPYLAKVSWTYFTKAIAWARKYGLRILLDFHALPGSQNGWNHSGHVGSVNWMMGVMGVANAQRSLEQLRSMVEYISQPGIREVVTMIGIVNEVQASVVGTSVLQSYYFQAYELARNITGLGAGKGPIVLIHEGFMGVAPWSGFLNGADRLALDQHPYLAFPQQQSDGSWDSHVSSACGWGGATNVSRQNFGITVGGEWSLAPNDCSYWLNGVDVPAQYEVQNVGSCTQWNDWQNFDSDMKSGMKAYFEAQTDALQDWFFWTWKIGNSTVMGYPASPQWDYKLGLQEGWIPQDPRAGQGYCAITANDPQSTFDGNYPASATGGVTTTWLNPDQLSSHSQFPPTSMAPNFDQAQIALMPTLTRTGSPITLASPTSTGDAGGYSLNGWEDAQDTQGAFVQVAGCSYPPEYSATAASLLPSTTCTGSGGKRDFLMPRVTAAP